MRINLYKLNDDYKNLEFEKLNESVIKKIKHGSISLEIPTTEKKFDIENIVTKKIVVNISSYVYYTEADDEKTDYSFINESFLGGDELYESDTKDFNKYFEETEKVILDSQNDPNDEIRKSSKNPNAIFILDFYDENGSVGKVALTFGYSFHKIKEFADQKFPINFISTYNEIKFIVSEIVFPFSRTAKTLNSHDEVDSLNTRAGSYLVSMDAEITNLENVLKSVVKSKKFSVSDSLTFEASLPIKSKENFNKLFRVIFEILKKSKQPPINKFPFLESVNNNEKEILYNYLISNLDNTTLEIKYSQTGFLREDNGEVSTSIEYDGYYFLIKYRGLEEKFYLDKNLLKNIINFCSVNNVIFNKVLSKLELFNEENISEKFSFWRLFDIIMDYDGKKYIHTNSKWSSISNDIQKVIDEKLELIDEKLELNLFDGFDFRNDVSKKFIEIFKKDTNETFYSRELIFNRSISKWIKNEKNVRSFVYDTTTTKKGVEITDIIYNDFKNNDEDIVMSHVKFGLKNDELSKNIDQSLTSFSMLKNQDKDFIEKLAEKNFDKKNIKIFELMIVLDESEYDKYFGNSTPSIKNLQKRMISKLKLLEWMYIIKAENYDFRINIVKLNVKDKKELSKIVRKFKFKLPMTEWKYFKTMKSREKINFYKRK